jgi:hypothetical protein
MPICDYFTTKGRKVAKDFLKPFVPALLKKDAMPILL